MRDIDYAPRFCEVEDPNLLALILFFLLLLVIESDIVVYFLLVVRSVIL